MREGFLPDGGLALAAGKVKLPKDIMITDNAIKGQQLQEVLPGRTMLHIPLFGYLFSFLIAIKPKELVDYLNEHTVLTLQNFRPGPPQTAAATLEAFRDVLCDALKRE